MSPSLIAAGVCACASGILLWLLLGAKKENGKLKEKLQQTEDALELIKKQVGESSELSQARIRDLTRIDPSRVRRDDEGRIWAE